MSFSFWTKYLKAISVFFTLLGISWAIIGSFDPLGIYDKWMAQAFYGNYKLPSNVEKAMKFILAPFGATSAGYFILQYFIVANAFAKKEKWAYNAITVAFFFWFFLDTALSWYHGAFFNIALANFPALLITLPALIFSRKYFR